MSTSPPPQASAQPSAPQPPPGPLEYSNAASRFVAHRAIPREIWPLAALVLLLLFNAFFTPGFFSFEIKNGRLYGTRSVALLDGAKNLSDLGTHFGGRFHEREARFLLDTEWARTAEDILDRRTKHGLHLTSAERAAFASWLAGLNEPAPAPMRTAT